MRRRIPRQLIHECIFVTCIVDILVTGCCIGLLDSADSLHCDLLPPDHQIVHLLHCILGVVSAGVLYEGETLALSAHCVPVDVHVVYGPEWFK